ncbi:MAG: membrane protein insertase YidC [Candidatus Binataceae bacterium]
MDTTRVLIAVVLSLVVVFAYQEIVLKRLYPPPDSATPKTAKPAAGIAPAQSAELSGSAPSAPSAAPAEAPAAAVLTAPERTIEVETDLYIANFTTRGARLKSFRLKRYTKGVAADSPLYEMVDQADQARLPLGLVTAYDATLSTDSEVGYTTDAPDRVRLSAAGDARVAFTGVTASGARLEKALTFKSVSYTFAIDASVASATPPKALGLSLTESLAPRKDVVRDMPELQSQVHGKVVNEPADAIKKGAAPLVGEVTYVGFGDRYFLSAYLPEPPGTGTITTSIVGDEATAILLFEGATQIKSRVFMGPKSLEVLESVNPALSSAIDFGWAGFLALPMLRTLKLFQYISPNWGVDIIVLTIVLRILILPMSIKSQRSMMRMQRLQPQMQRLREKLKDEPEKLNREMMDLYKRNHVNPLGGCLPMLIQLPIFVGLYEALLNSIELRHAPFIWWMHDLSVPDCLHAAWMPMIPYTTCQGIPVLVILMGLSTFAQQWMTPTSPDPQQQRMMMLMPIVFTVLLINFPAGLSLYYFSSNVLGIIQQLFLNREFRQQTPATA